ncbi:nicotinamide riboside transporter PnuC [Aliikangiella sp. IMCC44359]|uniref:nicotinamide riboside transporter PnuC n=1 Tax=Aliikangiella sp. IMCC44359 TaxID=3459125 RepID=UPI00403AD49F
MNETFQQLGQQLVATSVAEWVAVLLAIAYLIFAIKESVWCWPAAFFSTAIYSVLFFDVNLYMESLLNVYYLIMAIYGFYQWHFKKSGQVVKPIIQWSIKVHTGLIITVLILVFISGYLLQKYTDQDFAYLDSLTTWFAVITTYMVAQKVLENWTYWMVINSFSIFLYLQKGFVLTAILFISYLILAVIGWLKWKQHYEREITSTKVVAA